MNRAQFSMYVWSAYLLTAGTMIVIAPVPFFTWVGLHDPGNGMWLRLAGMLLGIMGYFFCEAARANNREFMLWGARARMIPIFFLTMFVLLGLENPVVLTFGIVDVITGLWTLKALRADAESRPSVWYGRSAM